MCTGCSYFGGGSNYGVYGAAIGSGGGAAIGSALGGPIGAGAGAVLMPTIGIISRKLARKMTLGQATFADDVIRAGEDLGERFGHRRRILVHPAAGNRPSGLLASADHRRPSGGRRASEALRRPSAFRPG